MRNVVKGRDGRMVKWSNTSFSGICGMNSWNSEARSIEKETWVEKEREKDSRQTQREK